MCCRDRSSGQQSGCRIRLCGGEGVQCLLHLIRGQVLAENLCRGAPIATHGQYRGQIVAHLTRGSWRIGERPEADAWWANGQRAQLLDDDSLRIASGVPGEPPVRLSLADVKRPIAFSEPLADPDFEPAYRFRLDEPATMAALLSLIQTQWRMALDGDAVFADIHDLVEIEHAALCIGESGISGRLDLVTHAPTPVLHTRLQRRSNRDHGEMGPS